MSAAARWRALIAPSAAATWLVVALAAVACVPLWIVRVPPLQDLPHHIALYRVLGSFGDPELGFSRYFTLNLSGSQYLLVPLLGAALGKAFGVVAAAKLLLSAAIVSIPLGVERVLARLGRERLWALFTLPLTYNSQLMMGFIPFLLAVGLMFWGWALALDVAAGSSRGRRIALGLVAAACLYSHVVPFALLGLGALAVTATRDLRAWALRLAPLVPAGLLALVGTARGGGSGAAIVGAGLFRRTAMCPLYDDVPTSLRNVPGWLTDNFSGGWDDALLVLWALGCLAVFVLAQRFSRAEETPKPLDLGFRLAVLIPPCAGLYFVMPRTCDWIFPIHARFLVIAAFGAPLLLPALRRAAVWPVAAGLAALAIVGTVNTGAAFRAADAETGAFVAATNAIPKGSKVAALSFATDAPALTRPPFLHYAALAQARRGGVVMFSFATLPHWPVRLRPEAGIPEPSWALQFDPGRVDIDRELAWADYVLVRDGPGPIADRPDFELAFAGPRWRTYRRR